MVDSQDGAGTARVHTHARPELVAFVALSIEILPPSECCHRHGWMPMLATLCVAQDCRSVVAVEGVTFFGSRRHVPLPVCGCKEKPVPSPTLSKKSCALSHCPAASRSGCTQETRRQKGRIQICRSVWFNGPLSGSLKGTQGAFFVRWQNDLYVLSQCAISGRHTSMFTSESNEKNIRCWVVLDAVFIIFSIVDWKLHRIDSRVFFRKINFI